MILLNITRGSPAKDFSLNSTASDILIYKTYKIWLLFKAVIRDLFMFFFGPLWANCLSYWPSQMIAQPSITLHFNVNEWVYWCEPLSFAKIEQLVFNEHIHLLRKVQSLCQREVIPNKDSRGVWIFAYKHTANVLNTFFENTVFKFRYNQWSWNWSNICDRNPSVITTYRSRTNIPQPPLRLINET